MTQNETIEDIESKFAMIMSLLKDISGSMEKLKKPEKILSEKTLPKKKINYKEANIMSYLIDESEFSFLENKEGKIEILDKKYKLIKTKEELQEIFNSLPKESSSKDFNSRRASVPLMKYFTLSDKFKCSLTRPRKSFVLLK